jgi:hypothetical protein
LLLEHLFPRQPKFLGVLGLDELVQRVLDLGLPQVWECARDHDEKNDTHGEYVSTLPSIVLLLKNFGGLILSGADLGMVDAKAILALLLGREAEVSHLQVVPRV